MNAIIYWFRRDLGRIGIDSPAPIVEHARERETALRLFDRVRKKS